MMMMIFGEAFVCRLSTVDSRFRHDTTSRRVFACEPDLCRQSPVAAEKQSSIKCLFATLNGNDLDGISVDHFTNGRTHAHVIIFSSSLPAHIQGQSSQFHMNYSLANAENAQLETELMNNGDGDIVVHPLVEMKRNKTNKMLLVVRQLQLIRIYCHFRRISRTHLQTSNKLIFCENQIKVLLRVRNSPYTFQSLRLEFQWIYYYREHMHTNI